MASDYLPGLDCKAMRQILVDTVKVVLNGHKNYHEAKLAKEGKELLKALRTRFPDIMNRIKQDSEAYQKFHISATKLNNIN
jgi:hypothetical protein